jgi:hypothetical protein
VITCPGCGHGDAVRIVPHADGTWSDGSEGSASRWDLSCEGCGARWTMVDRVHRRERGRE